MAIRVIDPTQARFLTVEEWAARPDADRFELIDGILRIRVVNQNRHEYAVGRLAKVLGDYLERSSLTGAVMGSNTKYQVRPRRGIMPDVSMLLGPQLDKVDPDAAFIPFGPDLAVEVLSPDQGDDYVEERLEDYWRLGTTEVWVINPGQRTVVGYTRVEQRFQPFGSARGGEDFSSLLLEDLTFSVGVLWMLKP
jgi:Uma2 family endonuclease